MSDRIEALLKEYPKMKMERKCLELQIKNFEGLSETDMIESLYFKRIDGDRVQSSGVSDKSSNIAITYRKKMERINQEWLEHLKKEYTLISEEIIFIESAICSLSKELSDFINDMVLGSLTWDKLSEKYNISRTTVANYRKKAILEIDILYSIRIRKLEDFLLS